MYSHQTDLTFELTVVYAYEVADHDWQNNTSPPTTKEVYVLIPYACEYAMSHGDRQFQLQPEIRVLIT